MSRSFQVMMVLPGGAIGGAERVLFNLTDYLLRNGVHVFVYVMSKGDGTAWNDFNGRFGYSLEVSRAKSEKTGLLGLLRFLFSRRGCDYVISSHAHVNALLSALRRIGLLSCSSLISRESTLIFDRFSGLKRLVFLFFYKFLYGKQDLLVLQTEEMQESLARSLGRMPVRQFAVLQNPVNEDYVFERLQEGAPNGIPPGRLLVAAGRFIELKGFHNLIVAFSELAKRHADICLVLLGDGPLRCSLEALAESLGVAERVIFPGRVSNPYVWFSLSEVGVCSSSIEGFPNVLIEMMVSGVAKIVSTPCTAAVTKLPGVVLSKSWDPDDLVFAIDLALSDPCSKETVFSDFVKEKCSVRAYWESIVRLTGSRA